MATLDPVIHAPNRLQICALLATSAELDFKLIKERLEVSDSVLSKHLKALESAGYISLKKRTHNGRPKTWVAITSNGLASFNAHVSALKAIIDVV